MATKAWNEFVSGDKFYLMESGSPVNYTFLYAGSDGLALCEANSSTQSLMDIQKKCLF